MEELGELLTPNPYSTVCNTKRHIGTGERSGRALVHLKGLGDDVVVEADVVPAMAAAVHPRPHQLRRHRRVPSLATNQRNQ